jgi:FkbM family methyltransferase
VFSLGRLEEVDVHRDVEFWRTVHRLALRCLGFGTGSDVAISGEREVVQFLARLLERKATIFDVGAHSGNYATMLSEVFPTAEIHAFEPSRATFETLSERVSSLPTVTPHNLAFGDHEGSVVLYSDRAGSGLASLHDRRLGHFGVELVHQEQVRITTIDAFCRQQSIDRIEFLKLDVEGHELAVLQGAADLIGRDAVDAIQFEFGGCNIDSKSYFQDFFYELDPTYSIMRITRCGLIPVAEYSELDEVFVTTNYLALARRLTSSAGKSALNR